MSGNKSGKTVLKRIIITVIWLVIWQIISSMTGLGFLFAGPVSVLRAFVKLLFTSSFYYIIANSLCHIMIGFLISLLTGIVFGTAAGFNGLVKDILFPVVHAMKSLPIAAIIILLFIFAGAENVSSFVAFIMTFPFVYEAFCTGIMNTDKNLVNMSKVYCVNKIRLFRCVYIREIEKYLISGLGIAVGMCWKAGVSAEVITIACKTIGEQMYYSKIYIETDILLAWSIIVILVSLICEKVVITLIKYLVHFVEKI